LLVEYNFGGINKPGAFPASHRKEEDFPCCATCAILTITLSVEGDSIKDIGDKMRSRRDLKQALLRIGSESQADDWLLGAEVLWAPEDRWDILYEQDIYADYPSLYPLYD
jgi:uncharacterized membrane protein